MVFLVVSAIVGLTVLTVVAACSLSDRFSTGASWNVPNDSFTANPPHAKARVLFCQPDRELFTLDCALVGGDVDQTGAPAGTPFALRLRAPETPFFSDVATATMRDWADGEQVIEVELSPNGQRATLDDGSTRLYLALGG